MVCPAFDQSGSSGRKTADQTRVESEVSGSCAGVVTGIEIKTRSPGAFWVNKSTQCKAGLALDWKQTRIKK